MAVKNNNTGRGRKGAIAIVRAHRGPWYDKLVQQKFRCMSRWLGYFEREKHIGGILGAAKDEVDCEDRVQIESLRVRK